MNTINVQVCLFKSFSDSYGNRLKKDRPGIVVHLDGKTKLIPITSNDKSIFDYTKSLFSIDSKKFGINFDSWLAFGFEVDYDKSKRSSIVRKSVEIDLDDLKSKRSNYHADENTLKDMSPY